jgi:hypothetical protein
VNQSGEIPSGGLDMKGSVTISLREVDEAVWEEFHLESVEGLRGEQGLLYAKEWLLWTQLQITIDGCDLLPTPSSPSSPLMVVTDLPHAVEAADRVGSSEWFVAHEGPYLTLKLDEHHEQVSISRRSYGEQPTFVGEAPWPSWVAAARTCVAQARLELTSRVKGPHIEIMDEWLRGWARW